MGIKKWLKPECMKIKLVPEEAVLTGCKLGTGGSKGPGTGNCKFCQNLTS